MTAEQTGQPANSELEAVFQALPDLYFRLARDGTILDYRARHSADLYVPPEEFMGRCIQEVLPAEIGALFIGKIAELGDDCQLVKFEYALNVGSNLRYFEARVASIEDSEDLIVIVRDVDDRKHIEVLQAGEHAILEQVSRGNVPLERVLDAITHFAEAQYPTMRCAICRLDGTTLHNGAAPSLPVAYNALIDGLQIGPRVGSCGTAAFRKQRVIVADVTTDPLWADISDLGPKYGFRACWSQPVLDTAGQVLGTFALYHAEPCEPDDDEIRFIETMAHLTAIAMERERVQGALQESENRFRTIFEQAGVGVRVLETASGCFLRANQRYSDIVGYTQEELIGSVYTAITHPDDLQAGQEQLARLAAGTISEFTMEKRYIHKDGHTVWVRLTVTGTDKSGEKSDSNIAVVEDITDRKRLEAIQAGERKILELISKGETPLSRICEAIIKFSEHQYPEMRCVILRCEDGLLRVVSAPSMPDSYFSIVDGKVEAGLNGGSCGAAIYRKERVVSADISSDLLWVNFRHMGLELGFRACWAEPIIATDGNVLGTFSLYRAAPGEPDSGEVHLIESMTRITAIAMEREQTMMQLQCSEAEWLRAMEQFDDVIYLLDKERRLVRGNSAFYRMVGLDREHSVGRPVEELVHPEGEETPCPVCVAQKALREGVFIMEPDDPNNPLGRPLELSLRLVRDEGGAVTGIAMNLHDLSLTRQIEQRQRLAATVFESTAEGVVITDPDGTIVDVNRAFSEIMGYSREEVLGKNPRIWKSGRHDESFYRDMWHTLKEAGYWRGEIWNRRRSGELVPEWGTISGVSDEQGRLSHYVAVFSDISAIKQTQEKLEHLAHYDALTDLPNRLLFNARLAHAVRHAERHDSKLAVLFLDLDRFKNINDSLGHSMGDELLCQISGRLKKRLRREDTVARLGGDEFVVLLENLPGPHSVAVMAEKLMDTLRKPVTLEAQPVHISVSVGISIYPDDGRDSASLVRNADAAMYRAKESGRNTYEFYTAELTSNTLERVAMENDLWQAVARDELYLLYQPQVEFPGGRIVGVEALVRWQHPTLGTISPAWFIPIAEECGLIHSLGEWVLNTACAQGSRWLEQGLDFGRIAVNLSGKQLQRGGMVGEVKEALARSGLAASRLELEVTENFIMQGAEQAVVELSELREMGVTLAIDDFGTGYSSLSYLKQLPIHKLKIDQSFVRDIPKDANDMAISKAVIALGKNLSLSVIAEGVETVEQAEFLQQAGCEEAQGYLYSRPVSAAEVEKLLVD